MTDPRLTAAVAASRGWYDDVFGLHGIPVGSDGRLWWAEGAPPRWHSSVKSLVPGVGVGEVVARTGQRRDGSVADSFGRLDLTAHGFELLFAATWVHHPGVPAAAAPAQWVEVRDADLMARWNHGHDTVGVLPTDLPAHPRFTVLARLVDDRVTGGAVLHDAGTVVELSNWWSADEDPVDPRALLVLAARAHPARAVVGYARGAQLDALVADGFAALGPQHVWVR